MFSMEQSFLFREFACNKHSGGDFLKPLQLVKFIEYLIYIFCGADSFSLRVSKLCVCVEK